MCLSVQDKRPSQVTQEGDTIPTGGHLQVQRWVEKKTVQNQLFFVKRERVTEGKSTKHWRGRL